MDKKFYWLYVTVFINILSFGMVFPILPLFAKSFNATLFQVGLLIAVFSLSQFLFAPFAGKLSDRYGRKPIFLFSIAIATLSLLFLSFSNSLTMVFIGMAFQGLGSAGIFPTALAYVADITKGHVRSKYISRVTGTFALGFMIGPIIGGALGSNSLSLPFLFASIVGAVNLVIIAIFLHETHHDRDTKLAIKEGIINPKSLLFAMRGKFGALFFLLFSWSFYTSNFSLTVPFFTQEKFGFGALEIGLFFSSIGLVAAITQWFILPLVEKRIGDVRVIIYGLGLMIVGQMLVPSGFNLIFFYAFFMISIIGSALIRPSASALISKRTVGGQGATMGLATSFESLGRIAGPLILGLVLVQVGVEMPFYITGFLLLGALFIFHRSESK